MESGGEHTREYLTLKRNVSHITNSLAAQVDPGLFAQKLCEKGLVSSYVVQKASVPEVPAHRVQDVLQAVLTQISLKPSKYLIFIEVLKDDNPVLADKLTEFFESSPEKQLRAPLAPNTISSNHPEGGSDHPMQVAIIPGSDDQPSVPLTEVEGFDLSDDFAGLYCKVVTLLAKAVTVDTLKRYLKTLRHPFSKQPYINPSLFQHSTSVEEILDLLEGELYFHPTQITLLGKIVKTHGCSECRRLLQEYDSKIPKSTPLKRSRNDLTDEKIESSSGTKRVKIEVSGDVDTYCLEDVEKIQKALENSTGVDRVMIVYVKHEPGSVILTFIVPVCMVECFTGISKSTKQLSDLAAIGILSINIDQVTINVKAHLVHQKLQDLSLEQKAAHPTPLKLSTLKPTPSSEGTDSGGVGDPTLPKKEIHPAVRRLLQEQIRAQAMKLKPHPVGGLFEKTTLPGMSGGGIMRQACAGAVFSKRVAVTLFIGVLLVLLVCYGVTKFALWFFLTPWIVELWLMGFTLVCAAVAAITALYLVRVLPDTPGFNIVADIDACWRCRECILTGGANCEEDPVPSSISRVAPPGGAPLPMTIFIVNFKDLADLDTLIPQLAKHMVLGLDELDHLHWGTLQPLCRAEQITRLLYMVSHKGWYGVNGMISSLVAETQHMGHSELADILKNFYSAEDKTDHTQPKMYENMAFNKGKSFSSSTSTAKGSHSGHLAHCPPGPGKIKWCVVDGNQIQLFKNASDKRPQDKLVLADCDLEVMTGGVEAGQFAFRLMKGGKGHTFTAKSKEELDSWIGAVKGLVKQVVYQAKEDHIAEDDSQLTFKKGTYIKLLGMDNEDVWTGQLGNEAQIFAGKVGQFPANKVEIAEDLYIYI